jgi:primosomal protein N' (replication factor Y) (superfamily II helicase)
MPTVRIMPPEGRAEKKWRGSPLQYVLVAINLPVRNLFKQFVYRVPEGFPELTAGWRVLVPFGSRKAEGFVVRVYTEAEARRRMEQDGAKIEVQAVKELAAVVGNAPWFDEEMLATARWLAQYYMCTEAEAMRLFIPGKSSLKRRLVYQDGKVVAEALEERLKPRTVLAYALTEQGRQAVTETAEQSRFRSRHKALVLLQEATPESVTVKEAEAAGIHAEMLRTLARLGWAEKVEKRVLRNSYDRPRERKETLQLTAEQQQAVETVRTSLRQGVAAEYLLRGITGSGKTEVYLRAAEEALREGRQVLVLVPEIALTTQIVQRFRAWFGDAVAVAHSKLSQNERGDVWYKMRNGTARILIGVRSAVFAPFENLGLVIIDEEQETSYKQEERPSYHAREVARCRCRLNKAVLLLGSATPSLDSYYLARTGAMTELRLTERPSGAVLPKVTLVDMRDELAQKNFSVLSRRLRQEIVETVRRGEQAIILLNRRGFSTFVMCRDCGTALVCPHCAVSLVYHAKEQVMRCHYCGREEPVPHVCPHCGSRRIKFFGSGTQKAEAALQELPGVRVLRMDQDSTAGKMAHEEIIRRFQAGEANVLLGTQMVAKGHDIKNVTLVGILTADSSLNLPDFRAAEMAFDLLTQTAGRAGRGTLPGHVVLQTYDPDNEIIRLAARQDYDRFATGELQQRKVLHYPPYSRILKLTSVDKEEEKALQLGEAAAAFLRHGKEREGWKETTVTGPFPAGVAKVRDLYRFTIIVRSGDMERVKEALWHSPYRDRKNLYFDVDPLRTI